jgi:hypothetical protein
MANVTDFKNTIFILLAMITSVIVSPSYAQTDSSYNSCLQQNENPANDPKIANQYGYSGLYQFGVSTAAAAGLCSNVSAVPYYKSVQNWEVFNKTCDFKGSVALQYGVKSYADWTSGAKAREIQNAMLEVHKQKNWNEIVKLGLSKYEGKTIGGVTYTRESLLAVAHLLGVGGLQKTLAGAVKADANGTTGAGYASCLASCLANGGKKGECTFKYNGACAAFQDED